MRLQDKLALITGGTSGIGRDAALRFAKEGAEVIFTGRNKERANSTLQEIEALGGKASFYEHDVTSEASWQDVTRQVAEAFGKLDVLVNNAGIFLYGPIEDTPLEDFQVMWQTNVDSVFLGMKYCLPLLRASEGTASVINISSLSGMVGHPDCVSYCSSKSASLMLTRVMAMEAAPKVRVNALAPGPVWNELLERAHEGQDAEEMKTYYRESQPLKLMGESADVTGGLVFLASQESRYVNGSLFRIDAGRGAD
jgi:NAD(P)-dependent dehydrogenase (short-subunit alcohol dehydrogenase family)